jgi:replicative DNA helicase
MSNSPAEYSIAPTRVDPYKDRRPPYSEDAEQAVIGAMLLDQDAIMRAAEHVDDTMFYREGHRRIFRAMLTLTERGEVVDPLTLSEELSRRAELEASGGKEYIAYLVDAVPTAANVEYHARIVREKALLRRLIEISTGIVGEAFEGHRLAAELLDEAEAKIFQVAQAKNIGGFTRIKELLWPAMERIEAQSRSGTSITGLASGFKDLDEMTSGFQPADLVILAARPSLGKCVAADTEIVLADGRLATIEEIYRAGDARLLTLGDDWKLRPASPSAGFDDGRKPVFRVTTRLGRRVDTTITHPFRTLEGWRPLGDLAVGARVAVPRTLPVFGAEAMRECEVKLLGYLLGDGGLTDGAPTFTNADPRLRDDFAAAVDAFGGVRTYLERSAGRTPSLRVARDRSASAASRDAFATRLTSAARTRGPTKRRIAAGVGVSAPSLTHWTNAATTPSRAHVDALATLLEVPQTDLGAGLNGMRAHEPNALTTWAEQHGLWGRRARDKRVPAAAFALPREQMALLLNRLFATDGWATVLASGQPQLGFASASEAMARQVQHLLLRFGIVAAVRARTVAYRGERRAAWQLDVTDGDAIVAFGESIGMFGKETALERAVAAARGARRRPTRDRLPLSVWNAVDRARGAESWASLASRVGFTLKPHRATLDRPGLATLARALGDADLAALASSDVLWDEIVAIEPLGTRQVYDLTIPDTHNFVANDVCVHNTAFTLNIAQHAAITDRKAVAFFSLEMSKDSLVQRMLTSEARIDAQTLRKGRLRDDDFPRLARAAGILSHAPVFIDDTPGISIMDMRSKARRLKADHGLDLIIVDYLQLMTVPNGAENRQQEVSIISRGLKALAKELAVPVVALSQLSRAVEQRAGAEKGRPVLSDLRESGAIEQDADLIMFLFREEVYAERENGQLKDPGLEGKAEVIIGKQRNGPIGSVPLFFHKQYTRFESVARGAYQSE